MLLIPAIFVIFGLTLAVKGLRMFLRTRSFLGGAVQAKGEIVSWREEANDGDATKTTKFPTLRFTAHDGRMVETEADVGVSFWPADDEAPVNVLYDPADPAHARLSTLDGRGYTEALMFLLGGLALAIVPVVIAFTSG